MRKCSRALPLLSKLFYESINALLCLNRARPAPRHIKFVRSLSLDSETDTSLPCLTMTTPDNRDTSSMSTSSSTSIPNAFWHVRLHVLRPNGVANSGTLLTTVRNEHTDCGAKVSFVQTIPAVLLPRWQSLAVQCSTAGRLSWTELADNNIEWKHKSHTDTDDSSVVMQFRHELAPESSLSVSLDYNPAFSSFENIPGDANRGVELPPVQVYFVASACNNRNKTSSGQLYSQSVLLLTPLPDMSMPFNVLSLTCTLFAFIVGSLINVLVRRGTEHVKYQLDPSSKPKSKLDKLKAKVRRVKENLWKKQTEPDKSSCP
jgi:hypothetical protein